MAVMRLGVTARLPPKVARLGIAGFLFFLVKGLLWLVLPAWFYFTR
jgi:hypothetical protein